MTYCLTAARRAQNSGYAIIQEPKLSVVIEPVCMPKQRRRPRRRRCKLLTVGIFFTT